MARAIKMPLMQEANASALQQAYKSRDARFDGRFFVGVMSTGIYCRPICPARSPKIENVRFFPSAAAAAGAGLRPCLRCCPESSPGTPAWLGTASTVSRALRLIDAGLLNEAGVEALSEKLGVTGRHLRRLFRKHLGASPSAVAQTRRLHFAKKLIDETELSMLQVAMTSGFGSLRRFNATVREVYGRTPSQLREACRKSSNGGRPERDVLRLKLDFRPPYDWDGLIEFLSLRAIPGVESVNPRSYRRTIWLLGKPGWLEVRLAPAGHALQLTVRHPDPSQLLSIVERVRSLFDLAADPEEIARQLGRHPLLAERVKAFPGLRVPGCWDPFELLVRAVLGQQVSVRGASTLAGRLAESFGVPLDDPPVPGLDRLFPAPQALAEADVASIGLPLKRGETIRAVSRAVLRGEVVFDPSMNLAQFVGQLTCIPGIGEWTAHYAAMRGLRHPDAFPAADLGLLKSLSDGPQDKLTAGRLNEISQAWRPWRAYAALYLWRKMPPVGQKQEQQGK